MTVGELMRILAELPEDYEVVLSSDGEGNGYSPFGDWSTGTYIKETSWSGYLLADDAEDEEDEAYGDDDDDPRVDENGERWPDNCVVLWPTN